MVYESTPHYKHCISPNNVAQKDATTLTNDTLSFNKIMQVTAFSVSLLALVACNDKQSETPTNTSDAGHTTNETPPAYDPSLPPLPIEETGHVETLPASYPESWILVDEANFFNMSAGKVIILDTAEKVDSKRIKGIIDKSFLGNLTQGKKRPEIYIIETFQERGTRGKKLDYLTIYNKETLKIVKEIPWPTDRLQALPERYSMSLSADEKFLYVSNFTPASSFTVVNLDTYEIVGTVDTPGCVLTFPSGERGVMSICSNGGLLSVVLDDEGKLASRHTVAPFFDSMETPIFEHPAIIDGIAYFPSFKGLMHEVDLRNDVAKYKGSWNLLSEDEQKANFRPGGLVLIDNDDQGNVYLIMQPNGHEGSHQHGGDRIWVYDAANKKRVATIDAPKGALSLGVTRGDNPVMAVTNGELAIEVYNTKTGEIIRTLTDLGTVTPLLINKAY